MKTVVVAAVLVIATGTYALKLTNREVYGKFTDISKQCASKGTSFSVVTDPDGRILEATDESCFLTCAYKIFELIQDEEYNIEAFMDTVVLIYHRDSPEYTKMKQIAEMCKSLVIDRIDQECHIAPTAMACIMPMAYKHGLKMLL